MLNLIKKLGIFVVLPLLMTSFPQACGHALSSKPQPAPAPPETPGVQPLSQSTTKPIEAGGYLALSSTPQTPTAPSEGEQADNLLPESGKHKKDPLVAAENVATTAQNTGPLIQKYEDQKTDQQKGKKKPSFLNKVKTFCKTGLNGVKQWLGLQS